MSDIVKIYLKMVNNPSVAKYYSDISNYYKKREMLEEYKAFEKLLNERYSEKTSDTIIDSQ